MDYYKIKVTGIKDGSYSNSFKIKDKFFETFAKSEIISADISASTMLLKEGSEMSLSININGVVNNIPCDICTEDISIPLSSSLNFILKEDDKDNNIEDDIIYLKSKENEICIQKHLFEMIVLAMPNKRRHELNSTDKRECNKEMVNLINKYTERTEKLSDPRWEALKDITLK